MVFKSRVYDSRAYYTLDYYNNYKNCSPNNIFPIMKKHLLFFVYLNFLIFIF